MAKKLKSIRDYAHELSDLVKETGHTVDLDVLIKNLTSVVAGEFLVENHYVGTVAFSDLSNFDSEKDKAQSLQKAVYNLAFYLIREKNPCVVSTLERFAENQSFAKIHVREFKNGQDCYEDGGVVLYQSERAGV